jgi:hypothetical protein
MDGGDHQDQGQENQKKLPHLNPKSDGRLNPKYQGEDDQTNDKVEHPEPNNGFAIHGVTGMVAGCRGRRIRSPRRLGGG